MGTPDDATDTELLIAAATDGEAYARFYRRHVEAVLRYFARRVRDPELAADLTAEVFAEALRSLDRFEPRSAPAEAWLYAIARHVLSATLRRGAAEDRAIRRIGLERPPLDEEERAWLNQLGRHPGDGDLMELLDALPLEQRVAVVARVLDKRSYAAIATELGCSEAVIRKRVSRGVERLRERFYHSESPLEDYV